MRNRGAHSSITQSNKTQLLVTFMIIKDDRQGKTMWVPSRFHARHEVLSPLKPTICCKSTTGSGCSFPGMPASPTGTRHRRDNEAFSPRNGRDSKISRARKIAVDCSIPSNSLAENETIEATPEVPPPRPNKSFRRGFLRGLDTEEGVDSALEEPGGCSEAVGDFPGVKKKKKEWVQIWPKFSEQHSLKKKGARPGVQVHK